MKTLERLRLLKAKAVDRMTELNALSAKETRELTAVEKMEYDSRKLEAENLTASIADLETELAAQPAISGLARLSASVIELPDNAAALKAERENERLRGITIRERLTAAKLPADVVATLSKELIDGGETLEKASARIFEELAKISEGQPETRGHLTVTRDQGDTARETMSATLLHRYEPTRYKDQAGKAKEWMGYSLMEMARECLRRKGGSLSGRGPGEIAHLALSTSDFPNILADVANKTLRAGYELYPNTFAPFCRRATVRDFKNVNRTQLSGAPALLAVNEHGEIEQGYLTDGKEAYSIASYARILNITRKTIINDDLGALTRVPEMMGRKAAVLEGDIVWGKITGNANMADTNAIFSTAHGNIVTSGGAPSDATVGVMAKNMTLQTGLEGDTLNLMPKFIAAPINLRLTIQRLLQTKALILTVTNGTAPSADAQPSWINDLTPIFEPRLDAADGTGWYLFADPSQVDTVEYAYLEGQEGMYFETQMGFEVDGVKFKARHDFGAGILDYRGMQLNDGE
jgi:hypothetical protein